MVGIDDPTEPSATNPKSTGEYQAFVLVNITSSQVPAAYGTLAHTAMLNQFLRKTSKLTDDQVVNLNWIDHPFPINKKL